MYRNTTDFCILISYPETLLNSLIRSNNFLLLLLSLGFSVYKIMSSAETILLLPFQFWYHLFLFHAWLLQLELLVLYWIGVKRMGTLVLFPVLEGKLSTFHHWVCYLGACPYNLHYVQICYFYAKFVKCFLIMNECRILSNAFSVAIEIVKWFFSFILLMWCITLICIMLNHTCIPGKKSHLSMVNDPFNVLPNSVCYYFIENVCTYLSGILACSFLLVSFSSSGYQENASHIKWVWEYSLLVNVLEESEKG